jgi:hypothetical protein
MSRPSIISSMTLVSLMIVSTMLRAAGPGIAPADHTEYSPNHRFFLISSVKEKRTGIFGASGPSVMLWHPGTY